MRWIGRTDKHLRAFVFIEIILLIMAFLIWLLGSHAVAFYFLIMFVIPMVAATAVTFFSEKEYRDLRYELFTKRERSAGLGIITTVDGKVLLNRQSEYPWEGMWIIPGGYYSLEKGDSTLRDTAQRRLVTLVQDLGKLDLSHTITTGLYIAKTRLDLDTFEECMLQFNHAPINDEVYEIKKIDGTPCSEQDIKVNTSIDLKWWESKEVEGELDAIPPHMRDIILFVLDRKQKPDFWDIIEWKHER